MTRQRFFEQVLLLAILLVAGARDPVYASGVSPLWRTDAGLDSLREEVHRHRAPPPPQGEDDKPHHYDEDNRTGSFGEQLASGVVKFVLLAPFFIPYAALHDNIERQLQFAKAPYADGPGYLQWRSDLAERDPAAIRRIFSGAGSVEWGRRGNSIDRYSGWLRLEGPQRIGLDMKGTLVREDQAAGGHDQLGVVAGDLTFRFAQSERVQFRVGAGVRGLLDRGWTASGVDLLYTVECQPVAPWVASLELRGGTLGSAGVFEPRGTIGYTLHGWQFEAGYAGLTVGAVDLGGPKVAIRRWY